MIDKLAAWFVQHTSESGASWVSNEIPFKHVVGDAEVRGAADRIERTPDGDYVVIDLKTGRIPSSSEVDTNPQLGIYQHAIEAGGLGQVTGDDAHSAGAMLVFPRPNKSAAAQQQAPLRDAPDPDWVRRLIDESAAGMTGPSFVARIDKGCRMCSVKRCCPLFDEGTEVES